MMLAHGNFDFHPAVGIIAQNFNDFCHCIPVLLGINLNFADDNLTGFGFETRHAVLFQHDALVQTLVFRLKIATPLSI